MNHQTPESNGSTSRPWDASRRLQSDLRHITGDGVFFGWMVGAGETYFSAFALALGAGAVATGFLATAPLLAGAFLQLLSPLGVRRLGTPRRWVVLCACLQAATFIPLFAGALRGHLFLPVLFVAATIYWASGMGISSAWNMMIASLVPVDIRHRFFARRTRIHQLAILLAMATGGFLLQIGAGRGESVFFFAFLFGSAFVARLASARLLGAYSEPPQGWPRLRFLSPSGFMRRLTMREEGRFLLFLLLIQLAVNTSSPFFTPFMLKTLEFSYHQYMALLAASFVAKVATLPLFGRLAKQWGVKPVLALGVCGIAPLPALWLISSAFPYLFAIQIFSGAVWAAFELSVILLQLELIRESERASMLAYFNLANAMAQILGTLLGGTLLWYGGAHHGTYTWLFALSTGVRIVTLVALRLLRGTEVPAGDVVLRILAVRPALGSLARPIHASFRRARRDPSGPLPPT